jgi:antirestriction protein ArdC
MAVELKQGYEDPRWMTYRQAQENGWHVRKGEKGTHIEFWQFRDERDDRQSNNNEADSDRLRHENARGPFYRVYTVFNAHQIDGVPPHTRRPAPQWEVVEAGDQILKNSGAEISHDQSNRAFYHRATDSIHLPPQRAFASAADYYGTALHELAHNAESSTTPSRLAAPVRERPNRLNDAALSE